MMIELEKLRVSVARIAQLAGVSLAGIKVADDAPYEVLCAAARQHDRGWNALCAAICEKIEEDAKYAAMHATSKDPETEWPKERK